VAKQQAEEQHQASQRQLLETRQQLCAADKQHQKQEREWEREKEKKEKESEKQQEKEQ
jgi:hypothetical protein